MRHFSHREYGATLGPPHRRQITSCFFHPSFILQAAQTRPAMVLVHPPHLRHRFPNLRQRQHRFLPNRGSLLSRSQCSHHAPIIGSPIAFYSRKALCSLITFHLGRSNGAMPTLEAAASRSSDVPSIRNRRVQLERRFQRKST
jgi:hypothetical protein